jgi:hypothetical protein
MRYFILVVLICACSYSLQSGLNSAGASPAADSGGNVSGPATWARYDVRGVQLNMTLAQFKAKGFRCREPGREHSCYKLIDKRCDTGRCVVKQDEIDQWFELNGAKTDLEYVTCQVTDTDAGRCFEIHYAFAPRQLLTPNSTLGKALIAKYGPASSNEDPPQGDPKGGGRMIWSSTQSYGPEIIATCNGNELGQCSIQVDDYSLRTNEQQNQAEIDKQKMLKNQPTQAPQL